MFIIRESTFCLLPKLACLTNFLQFCNFENWQTCNQLFALHSFQPLHIYMSNTFVPDFNICNNTCTLCKHYSIQLGHIYIKSKHSAHFLSLRNQLSILLIFFHI